MGQPIVRFPRIAERVPDVTKKILISRIGVPGVNVQHTRPLEVGTLFYMAWAKETQSAARLSRGMDSTIASTFGLLQPTGSGNRIPATDAPSMLFAPSKRVPDAMRREHVRQLFVVRCPAKRTANDVLNFFLWLRQRGPDLLPRGKQGDAYQRLKVDLSGLYLQE